mmetsp:Transcript_21720/g.63917  ORF Transcript_21720/g.63917 Transcript_21720/m.63917 type:complete len:86 (+) Transcript_21720:450-707(+)
MCRSHPQVCDFMLFHRGAERYQFQLLHLVPSQFLGDQFLGDQFLSLHSTLVPLTGMLLPDYLLLLRLLWAVLVPGIICPLPLLRI